MEGSKMDPSDDELAAIFFPNGNLEDLNFGTHFEELEEKQLQHALFLDAGAPQYTDSDAANVLLDNGNMTDGPGQQLVDFFLDNGLQGDAAGWDGNHPTEDEPEVSVISQVDGAIAPSTDIESSDGLAATAHLVWLGPAPKIDGNAMKLYIQRQRAVLFNAIMGAADDESLVFWPNNMAAVDWKSVLGRITVPQTIAIICLGMSFELRIPRINKPLAFSWFRQIYTRATTEMFEYLARSAFEEPHIHSILTPEYSPGRSGRLVLFPDEHKSLLYSTLKEKWEDQTDPGSNMTDAWKELALRVMRANNLDVIQACLPALGDKKAFDEWSEEERAQLNDLACRLLRDAEIKAWKCLRYRPAYMAILLMFNSYAGAIDADLMTWQVGAKDRNILFADFTVHVEQWRRAFEQKCTDGRLDTRRFDTLLTDEERASHFMTDFLGE